MSGKKTPLQYGRSARSDLPVAVSPSDPVSKTGARFVFATFKDSHEGFTQLLIGRLDDWKNRRALSDHYADEERERIEEVLEKHSLAFDEVMESHFEHCDGVTPQTVKKLLLKEADFTWDPDFQKRMEY